jgi:hypothetical protein
MSLEEKRLQSPGLPASLTLSILISILLHLVIFTLPNALEQAIALGMSVV